jgi:hypothetical protein
VTGISHFVEHRSRVAKLTSIAGGAPSATASLPSPINVQQLHYRCLSPLDEEGPASPFLRETSTFRSVICEMANGDSEG